MVSVPESVTNLIIGIMDWANPMFQEFWPVAMWGFGIYLAFCMMGWLWQVFVHKIKMWTSSEHRYEHARHEAMAKIRASRELDEDWALWLKSKQV